MGLRINNNITALIAWRNLDSTNFSLQKSIERLSSGLRINRASDDPANFITSEQMRTQIEGINQAITNTVDSVSMLQTAEGTFDQIEGLIRSIRTLALHAVNTGPNDSVAIANDQTQIKSAIDSLNNIATTRKYGSKVLLDGGLGRQGAMAASTATLSTRYNMSYNFTRTDADSTINANFVTSGTSGTLLGTLQVMVSTRGNLPRLTAVQSVATFGASTGAVTLNVNETLTVNGIQVKLTSGMNILGARNAINAVAAQTGASAVVIGARATKGTSATFTFLTTASLTAATNYALRLYSRNAGSQFTISVTSDTANSAGRTSGFGAAATTLQRGKSAIGNIRLRYARASGATFSRSSIAIALTGKGNTLYAADQDFVINLYRKGNTRVNFKGLAVNLGGDVSNVYKSTITGAGGARIGGSVLMNALSANAFTFNLRISESPVYFQIGPNKGEGVSQSISNMQTNALGLSGQLTNLDVRSQNGANAALTITDEALSQVLKERGRLGAFQKQFLETTKANLSVYKENYQAAESNIRDTDVASEMITFTRTQILMQSGTAMLAQANLSPQGVLQLLR